MSKILNAFFLGVLFFSFGPCFAAQEEYLLTIKDKKVSPAQLNVPSGQKIQILVKNLDKDRWIFYSFDLDRKQSIAGQSQATIYIGPLKAGRYEFNEKYHLDIKGLVVAE